MIDDFMALSETLTGIGGLDRALGIQYLERCKGNDLVSGTLNDLLAVFAKIRSDGSDPVAATKSRILGDARLGWAAQQIIFLWYVSAFWRPNPSNAQKGTWEYDGPPEHYGRGLMWTAIGAHAPMVSPSEWSKGL